MPMWRCPHCATPQAETARCWVCHRSSTACGTCRNFRRSVAAQLGYCGLDARRQPLHGDEIRACWEASPVGEAAGEVAIEPARSIDERRRLDFVEVGAIANGLLTP